MLEVKRESEDSYAARRRTFGGGQPIVFASCDWEWSRTFPEQLDRAPTAASVVAKLEHGRLAVSESHGVDTELRPLAEAIRASTEGERYLVTPLTGPLRGLVPDEKVAELIGLHRFLSMRVWVGSAGTHTPLHQDIPHNLLMQCSGQKRVWLAPPKEGRHLLRHSWLSRSPNFALSDLEQLDGSSDIEVYGCGLTAGEALYIPPGWWHQVRCEESGTSLNLWFADGPRAIVARCAQLYARWRALHR